MSTEPWRYTQPKEIVIAVMKFEGIEQRAVNKKSGNSITNNYLSYSCPNPCFRTNVVALKDKAGFQNPCSHLKSCFFLQPTIWEAGAIFQALYREAVENSHWKGGSILHHFNITDLSNSEKARHMYLCLCVMKNVSASCVEHDDYKTVSRFKVSIPRKQLFRQYRSSRARKGLLFLRMI